MILFHKIDIVYLWVDGSDSRWVKKKEKFIRKNNNSLNISSKGFAQSNNKKRFANNNELKYSLRSLEKYANWINNIFIVTDNQIPKWLNLNNPRIHIVDHKEIMPKTALPNFNSNSIEHCVVNIKGLSEYFLLANDDCFFGNTTRKRFFYTISNKPKWRLFHYYIDGIYSEIKEDRLYELSIINSIDLINSKYKKFYPYLPGHNIIPLRKSLVIQCYNEFSNKINNSINNHFRTSNDIQREIYMMYAHAVGKAKLIFAAFCNKDYFTFNHSMYRHLTNNTHVSPKHLTLNIKEDKNVQSTDNKKYIELNLNSTNNDSKPNSIIEKKPNLKLHNKFLNKLKRYLWYLYKFSLVTLEYFDGEKDITTRLVTLKSKLFCLNDSGDPVVTKIQMNQIKKLFPNKSTFEN